MAVQHHSAGPLETDPRLAAVYAARAEQARRTARGTSAWTREDDEHALERVPLRIPELLLGALLAMEVFAIPVGGTRIPLNELAMMLLLLLALCRRATRDASALGVAALAAGAVALFLAVVSVSVGIEDLAWMRRLVRISALAVLVGCFAARRLDLRSVLWGLLAAMAVNVPLFYAGVVPAPYGSYLTGFLGDKNVAGLYYAAMPVLAVAFVRSPQRRVMVLAAAAPCVFLTGSRTSMAGFACAVLWMWLTPRLGPVFRILILAAMGWAVTFAEENLAQLSVFGDRTGTDQLRSWIQDATAVKAAETPWFGRGLTEAYVTIDDATWHYHNSYAGLFTEGGYVLVIAVLAAYLYFGLRVFTTRLRTPSRVAVEAATAVIFVTAAQLGEVFLTIPGMLILATGASLALQEKDAPLETEVTERQRAKVLHDARARWG